MSHFASHRLASDRHQPGRYAATATTDEWAERRGFWTRRRKIIAVVALLLAVPAIVLAAALLRAPLIGGLNVPAADAELRFVPLPDTASGSPLKVLDNDAECAASIVGDQIELTAQGLSGTSCTIVTAIQALDNGANRDAKVQDVDFTDGTDEALVSAVYENQLFDDVTVPSACGRVVPTAPEVLRVAFTVTVSPDMSAGDFPAVADAGVKAVAADDYVDGNCPR